MESFENLEELVEYINKDSSWAGVTHVQFRDEEVLVEWRSSDDPGWDLYSASDNLYYKGQVVYDWGWDGLDVACAIKSIEAICASLQSRDPAEALAQMLGVTHTPVLDRIVKDKFPAKELYNFLK